MPPEPAHPVRVAVAVSTVGRPELLELLASLAGQPEAVAGVALANQSGRPLAVDPDGYPFPVTVVDSTGGVSAGRNDAVDVLGDTGEVLAFPNDDSRYPSGLLVDVARAFEGSSPPVAVACRLQDPEGPRFVLPPQGQVLDRRTVWLAIEPATFVERSAFVAAGGFRTDMGAGSGSAWGSGEGTDLLLRLMGAGGRVVSRPDLGVLARGERRELDDAQLVRKHRSYARGTGHVYRVHRYPVAARARTVVGPLAQATRLDPRLSLSLRLAAARSLGRIEGLTGRLFERGGEPGRTWGP